MVTTTVVMWWMCMCGGLCVAGMVGPRTPDTTDEEVPRDSCSGLVSSEALLQELRTITDLIVRSYQEVPPPPPLPPPLVHDCTTLRQAGVTGSGLYRVFPFVFPLYCDMDTQGGGWTLIQRRLPQEAPLDFARGWQDYREGFGTVVGEMWLGLEPLYQLTHSGHHTYQLRVDMVDYQQGPKHALYQVFSVGPESDGYRLLVSNYSGTAGDALSLYHSGRRFSTFDRDQDLAVNRSCAMEKQGGWWFHACYAAHLNGRHPAYPPRRKNNSTEMRWWSSREHVLVLTHIEMKIRRQPLSQDEHNRSDPSDKFNDQEDDYVNTTPHEYERGDSDHGNEDDQEDEADERGENDNEYKVEESEREDDQENEAEEREEEDDQEYELEEREGEDDQEYELEEREGEDDQEYKIDQKEKEDDQERDIQDDLKYSVLVLHSSENNGS